MKRLAVVAAVVGTLCAPAAATEWIYCSDNGGEASFDFLTGTLDELAIAGFTISAGERSWASHTAYGPGEPVAVGQAFATSDMMLIDAVDEAHSRRIAELRLFTTEAGDGTPVYGGTLRVIDVGAWAVSCEGP